MVEAPLVVAVISEVVVVGATGVSMNIKHDNYDNVMFQTLLKSVNSCLLYTSPSPRDRQKSRMPSSA